MKFLEAVAKAGEQNYIVDHQGAKLRVKDFLVITQGGVVREIVNFTDRDDWKIGDPVVTEPNDTIDFFKAVEALKDHKTIKSVGRDYFYRLTSGGIIECQHDGDRDWDIHMGPDGDEMNGKWVVVN